MPIVSVAASADVTFRNVSVSQNSGTGIFSGLYINNLQRGSLENCEFNENSGSGVTAGLRVRASSAVVVAGCMASDNQTTASSTASYGFLIDNGSTNCSLVDSTARLQNHDVFAVGIGIDGAATNNFVARNTLLNNNIGINNGNSSTGLLQNYADANTTDYVAVNPVVSFNKLTGVFTPAITDGAGSWYNISTGVPV